MALERRYKMESSARCCSVCERAFGVGDDYYSAVIETQDEDRLARRDFCPACWEAARADADGTPQPGAASSDAPPPPAGTGDRPTFFSFWKTRVPEPKEEADRGPRRIDLDRLMAVFERLGESEDPGARRFRYVLALALMRKRRLRLVASRQLPGGDQEMTLRQVGSPHTHAVVSPGLSEEEMIGAAGRLQEVLDMPAWWEQDDEPGSESS